MTNRAEDKPSSEIGFISEAEEERERETTKREDNLVREMHSVYATYCTHVSLDRRGRIARIDRRIRNVPTCVYVCKQGEVDAMY